MINNGYGFDEDYVLCVDAGRLYGGGRVEFAFIVIVSCFYINRNHLVQRWSQIQPYTSLCAKLLIFMYV